MLNTYVGQGRLVAEPERRTTTTGRTVCSFTIACDRDFAGEDKKTDFIPCVAWEKTAEYICKYGHKGDKMIVTGGIQTDKYTDKEGQQRTSIKVVVTKAYCSGSMKTEKESEKVEAEPLENDIALGLPF